MRYVTSTFLGLALGERNAHSALAVIDVVEDISNRRNPVTFAFYKTTRLHVRRVHRLPPGTAYTDLPAKVRPIVNQPPAGHFGSRLNITFAVDAGGPGMPVLDILRKGRLTCNVTGAQLHGAPDGAWPSDTYAVSRGELAGTVRFYLDNGLLLFPGGERLQTAVTSTLPEIEGGGNGSEDTADALSIGLALWVIAKRQPAVLEQLAA